jgi:hypothetical protein
VQLMVDTRGPLRDTPAAHTGLACPWGPCLRAAGKWLESGRSCCWTRRHRNQEITVRTG